jgi:hypothetical protein
MGGSKASVSLKSPVLFAGQEGMEVSHTGTYGVWLDWGTR